MGLWTRRKEHVRGVELRNTVGREMGKLLKASVRSYIMTCTSFAISSPKLEPEEKANVMQGTVMIARQRVWGSGVVRRTFRQILAKPRSFSDSTLIHSIHITLQHQRPYQATGGAST